MIHTPESYHAAALEHAQLARKLHADLQEYGAAHYWAGLAVECMLRAYRLRTERRFDSRHNLADLVREARFYSFVPEKLQRQVASSLAEVVLRWRNDYRFCSAQAIEKHLRDSGLDWRIGGDRLKYSSAQVVKAALVVVSIGDRQWMSPNSSSTS